MPRTPRVEVPHGFHHVIAKGSGGESIVRDDFDRERLLVHLTGAALDHRWTCFAYCLLDTHIHLVLSTVDANLGRGMQRFLCSYARKFNERHQRVGNLFHTRFYSTSIESNEHLTSSIVYVLLNPVRAGLALHPELWPWSSYAASIGLTECPALLARDAVLELFDAEAVAARLKLKLAVSETRQRDVGRSGVRRGV